MYNYYFYYFELLIQRCIRHFISNVLTTYSWKKVRCELIIIFMYNFCNAFFFYIVGIGVRFNLTISLLLIIFLK